MQISNGVNNEETIYISLQEATQHCNYSQEYLSLRARQGRLRALKFGRNWVTKKEWLEEYLKEVEGYNNNLKAKKFVAPPENLPVDEAITSSPPFASARVIEETFPEFLKLKIENFKIPKPALKVRLGFVVVLVFVLLITGIFHGRESFKISFETLTPFVVELNENFDKGIVKGFAELRSSHAFRFAQAWEGINKGVQEIGGAGDIIVGTPTKIIFNTVSEIPQSFQFVSGEISSQLLTVSSQTASIGETVTESLKEYFQWLGQSYLAINDTLEKNLSRDVDNLVTGIKWLNSRFQKMVLAARDWAWEGWQFVISPWKEIPVVEEPLRPKPEEGAVIVPYPEAKLAEVKGKLEKAFSDKVEVKPDVTGRAGVIKLLIKEAEAQEYLYLIVPVSE